MSDTSKTVLVAGASRGLGLALAQEWLSRGWSVIATTRGPSPELEKAGSEAEGRLTIETLDVADQKSVEALHGRIAGRKLDVLFVNAGVSAGSDDRADTIATEEFTRLMVTNALSPIRVVERLGDLVATDGTIAIMSSTLGSVSLNDSGGWESYRASKAALNTLMRSYAARHRDERRTLALICPGWVRTDMGGDNAALGIEESIPRVVSELEKRASQPGLSYFNYLGETVPW